MGEARGVVGRWCEVLRELGEKPDFAGGAIRRDGTVKWFDFRHEEYDGLGAFTETLKKEGYEIGDELASRKQQRPQGLKMLRTLLKSRPLNGSRRAPWKEYDPSASPPPEPRAPYLLLSEEETRQVNNNARRRKALLNSWLLHTLDQAIAPLLVDSKHSRRWLIPLNTRGADGEPVDSGNHASVIGVKVGPGDGPREIQRYIRNQLSGNVHWVNWWKCKTVLSLGHGFTRHVIKKLQKNPRFWTGGFSNVGDWSPAGGPDDVVAWCGVGAARRDMPINATVIIFRGRLAATITIYPSIKDNVAKMQQCLDRWKALLLEPPESASTPAANEPSQATLAKTDAPP